MDNADELLATPQRTFGSSTEDMYYNLTEKEMLANISSKMQVPNRLSLDGRDLPGPAIDARTGNILDMPMAMAVPERILVAGSDMHISAKETIFTSDYDIIPTPNDLQKEANRLVELTTPPRVLTVEQQLAAIAERNHATPAPNVKPIQLDSDGEEGYVAKRTTWKQVGAAGDSARMQSDAVDLTPVVSQLSQRLAVLEEENRQRHNRELLLYPALALYVVIKVVRWFLSR